MISALDICLKRGLFQFCVLVLLNIYSHLKSYITSCRVRKQENGKNQLVIRGIYIEAFNSPRLGF